MSILKSLFTNCAYPKGRMGRAMLKFMNLCHAPLANVFALPSVKILERSSKEWFLASWQWLS